MLSVAKDRSGFYSLTHYCIRDVTIAETKAPISCAAFFFAQAKFRGFYVGHSIATLNRSMVSEHYIKYRYFSFFIFNVFNIFLFFRFELDKHKHR